MAGKTMMNVAKGVGFGVAIGCVAGAAGYSYLNQHKKGVKKNMSKALRNVSQLVDNVGSMF